MKIIKTITIIITLAVVLSCTYAEQVRGEFYPRLTVVVEKEQIEQSDLWIITCKDRVGNLWAFYDDEGEWDIGDIANLLMWNIGEREEDDEIIEVYWEGHWQFSTDR